MRPLATRAREKVTTLLPWRAADPLSRLRTETGLATLDEVAAFILFLKESLGRVAHLHQGALVCPHCTTMAVIERLERAAGRYVEVTDRKTGTDGATATGQERAR